MKSMRYLSCTFVDVDIVSEPTNRVEWIWGRGDIYKPFRALRISLYTLIGATDYPLVVEPSHSDDFAHNGNN